jgi:hypothetical protein
MRGAAAIALMVCLNGCGKSQQEQGLRESIVRLEAALDTGSSLANLRALVSELQTREQLAESHMSGDELAFAKEALAKSRALLEFWDALVSCSAPYRCTDTLSPSLRALGLFNDDDSYEAVFSKTEFRAEIGASSEIFRRASFACYAALMFADKALS